MTYPTLPTIPTVCYSTGEPDTWTEPAAVYRKWKAEKAGKLK